MNYFDELEPGDQLIVQDGTGERNAFITSTDTRSDFSVLGLKWLPNKKRWSRIPKSIYKANALRLASPEEEKPVPSGLLR